jgi:hypothetical protein
MRISSARTKLRGRLVERRQYRRYHFTGDDVFVFRHKDKKVGWITDMSRGGLSYEYIPTSESESENEIIDIFVSGKKRFFLPGLNCKVIYNRKEKATSGSYSPVTFKRCGLKCEFSENQAIRFDELFVKLWQED